ncbi:MAG TPA: AtpZ/AtpI family protein [Longimicrobiales bacterium]
MVERRKKKKPDPQGLLAAAGQYLGLGLQWAASTALFLFLGLLVDRWLGTVPLFTILGAFVGAGAGFFSMYRHLVIEPREREKRGEGDETEGKAK